MLRDYNKDVQGIIQETDLGFGEVLGELSKKSLKPTSNAPVTTDSGHESLVASFEGEEGILYFSTGIPNPKNLDPDSDSYYELQRLNPQQEVVFLHHYRVNHRQNTTYDAFHFAGAPFVFYKTLGSREDVLTKITGDLEMHIRAIHGELPVLPPVVEIAE